MIFRFGGTRSRCGVSHAAMNVWKPFVSANHSLKTLDEKYPIFLVCVSPNPKKQRCVAEKSRISRSSADEKNVISDSHAESLIMVQATPRSAQKRGDFLPRPFERFRKLLNCLYDSCAEVRSQLCGVICQTYLQLIPERTAQNCMR